MGTIIISYDFNKYWDEFLKMYNIRHDNYINDDTKFILYYYDEYHLMQIAFEFGKFFNTKTIENV